LIELLSYPKKFWSHVNSKTKVNSEIPNLIKYLHPDGSASLTNSLQEKTEILSNFFSSVFTIEPTGEFDNGLAKDINCPMADVIFSPQIVMEKLNKLNPSKSVGPDNIHPRVLKELQRVLSEPLSIIFNTSYRTGVVPNYWKTANITAIHKKEIKGLQIIIDL